MKEQIIQLPDNFEVKEIKDGKIILVEKKKKLTYKDVAEKLFTNKAPFYINETGGIVKLHNGDLYLIDDLNNCTSRKQADKLLAINKLMNVAKYLNGDWQPDWNASDIKYFIYYSNYHNELRIDDCVSTQNISIYFKSRELAEQAIEILGEETIRLALSTDY